MTVPSTLADIRAKFRKMTAQTNETDISDEEIDQYVNTFYLYDLPSNLKLLDLKSTYTFYTQPNVDTYGFDKDDYYSIEPPNYIGGIRAQYLQDRETFFQYWPKIAYKQTIATGDGTTRTFSGTTEFGFFIRSIDPAIDPYEKFKEVVISSQDSSGASVIIVDEGGAIGDTGNLILLDTNTVVGTINYVLGTFTVTFPNTQPPASDVPIEIQYTPYSPARPQSMMFYNNYFTLRPIPDDVYEVVINAYVKPTALINSSDNPTILQWWQLLAIGAARTWFSDQLDTESAAKIEPYYQEQISYVERRTLQQLTNQRSATIFTEGRFWPFGLQPPYF